MTIQKIETALFRALIWFKARTPQDKKNLMRHGVKLERIGVGVWRLYIDLEEAPYMPYTNEPWISPKWNGKQNPNEKWWNNTVEEFMRRVARELGGKIKNV